MKIDMCEHFVSIQGEGPSVGTPAIFLRFNRCNLRCKWCDTPYALEKTDNLTETEEIKNILLKYKEDYPNVKLVVITGGEPLLYQSEILELLPFINEHFDLCEIETNGTILPEIKLLDRASVNVSIKLPSSGVEEKLRIKDNVISPLSSIYMVYPLVNFKFVISNKEDIEEMEKLIKKYFIPKENIYIMPEGTTVEDINSDIPFPGESRAKKLVDYCIKNGYTFCDRLHIRIWGDKRGV